MKGVIWGREGTGGAGGAGGAEVGGAGGAPVCLVLPQTWVSGSLAGPVGGTGGAGQGSDTGLTPDTRP